MNDNFEKIKSLLNIISYRSDSILLRVLSYNMSFASQLNIPMGSEQDFVEQCQNVDRLCYSAALKRIAYLNKKQKLDVVGIQECEDPKMVDKIKRKLTHLDCYYRAGVWNEYVSKYAGALIMWDSTILGTLKNACTIDLAYAGSDEKDARPCGIVTTTRNITLIVAHFPWLTDEKIKKKIEDHISAHILLESNIIIMADTNDAKTFIHKEAPLIIKGRSLSQNMTKKNLQKKLKTCCWHKENNTMGYQNYDDTGDYILAENVLNIQIPELPTKKHVGRKRIYPKNTEDSTELYSDHTPVIAQVLIQPESNSYS